MNPQAPCLPDKPQCDFYIFKRLKLSFRCHIFEIIHSVKYISLLTLNGFHKTTLRHDLMIGKTYESALKSEEISLKEMR